MNLTQLMPIVRHLLQVGAGALVTAGYINEEASVSVVGLGVSVITLLWYQFKKKQ